jgi:nitronate monooxygenase
MAELRLAAVEARVMAAPMGGGPSTPQLVAAVGDAGGLGFLAGGYKTAAQLAEEFHAVRQLSKAPFGVNLFVPIAVAAAEVARIAEYAMALATRAETLGVTLGEPIHSDDDFAAKVELVLSERPLLVSFTFGLPPTEVVDRLRRAGVLVVVTVTSVGEGQQAAAAGADGLVVQGWEAGAHRGGFSDRPDDEELGLLPLLRLIRRRVDLPMVASGGLGDGAGVAAVLVAGACAAMLGTAFLRCPEAATSPIHAAALEAPHRTVVTRAFTGRRARGLQNTFIDEFSALAPAAYPEVHYLTAPLRVAARRQEQLDGMHLWAGQAHELARALPAGELVRQLVEEARVALQQSFLPTVS